MSRPLVSWLMPVYNCERTLSRALNSMLSQTYPNMEIIIVDDGSSDHSSVILEQYAQKDNRVKIFYNKCNLGISASLNYGLSLCKGKYIARMDADDFSYPERIEKQVAFMEDNPDIGILGTGVRRTNEKSGLKINEFVPDNSEKIRCWLLFNIQARHPTIMFRTDIVKRLNLSYPHCPAEDYALFASLISKVKMANLPEFLVDYYTGTDAQLTTVYRERIRRDNIVISRRAIEDTLDIDVSVYPDSLFGARGNDIVPFDLKDYLKKCGEFLNKMLQANLRKKCFDQDVFMERLNDEWGSMKAMAHLHSFRDFTFQQALDSSAVNSLCDEAYAMQYPSGKVIVYGTGSYAAEHIPILFGKVPYEIIAFCDSNPEKRGKEFLGKKIILPEELHTLDYDYIFISAPVYYGEIKEELLFNQNVPESKIINYLEIIDTKFFQDRMKWIEEYKHQSGRQKAYLFCAPDYNNLGDHAIAYAEKKFFEQYLDMDIAEIPTRHFRDAADIARHFIEPDDLILITGGGFLGSLWMNSENMTRKIISTYPDNKIIIMPQTLYWEEEITFKKEAFCTQQIYANHSNLTLCARDKVSLELMKLYYPKNHVLLVPDMVLSINWEAMIRKEQKREGALLCLKDDKESVLARSQREELNDICQHFAGGVHNTSNLYKYVQIEPDERKKLIREQLNKFRSAKICVTDRLHGMIFSVITETPCVVLNNCNHKLKASYEWFEKMPYVLFAENISDVGPKMEAVTRIEDIQFNSDIFSEYYKELINLVKTEM